MFDLASCLVMAQIQFSLIEKNKDWTSGTRVTHPDPYPPLSDNTRKIRTRITPNTDTFYAVIHGILI